MQAIGQGGRSCDLLFPDGVSSAGLLFVKEGGHFTIYRENETDIPVLDFVHGARRLDVLIDDMDKRDAD